MPKKIFNKPQRFTLNLPILQLGLKKLQRSLLSLGWIDFQFIMEKKNEMFSYFLSTGRTNGSM